MRMRSLVSLFVFLLLGISAHADTLSTFNLSGNLQDGSFNGTVTLDTTSGTFTDADFSAFVDGATFRFDSAPSFQEPFGPLSFANFNDAAGDLFQISLLGSLVGFDGGALCNAVTTCSTFGANYASVFETPRGDNFVTSGTLAAVTPEPSSFALLGTGLFCLAAVARRKFSLQ